MIVADLQIQPIICYDYEPIHRLPVVEDALSVQQPEWEVQRLVFWRQLVHLDGLDVAY